MTSKLRGLRGTSPDPAGLCAAPEGTEPAWAPSARHGVPVWPAAGARCPARHAGVAGLTGAGRVVWGAWGMGCRARGARGTAHGHRQLRCDGRARRQAGARLRRGSPGKLQKGLTVVLRIWS